MRSVKRKLKRENSDLIVSFLELWGFQENYEVWAPYHYQGILGFVDLVIEGKSEISLFKFARDTSNLEEDVKSLKLESQVFPKSRDSSPREVRSYLVLADSEENRRSIISSKKLLERQSFEILLLDQREKRLESIFELRYSVPRIFQTEGIDLEDEALDELICKPNHEELERALLDLDDPPHTITKDLVEEVDLYFKKNEQPPRDISSIRGPTQEGKTSYGAKPTSGNIRGGKG